MRVAKFNLESLDLPPRSALSIEARASVLRPALERLDADILCLQEINAQRVPGAKERRLVALDRLIEGTRYAPYHRLTSTGPDGKSAADVHNLVTLSRLPVRAHREVRHEIVASPQHAPLAGASQAPVAVRFERPLLVAEIALPDGRTLTVINLHLRAPLATSIAGEKTGPFTWRTTSGWAEGYYLSSLKRTAQALELRLLVDQLFDARADALILVAGDFNAEDHETPVRLAVGAVDDTGNAGLACRSLVVLDRALPHDRRWSVLHAGRPQMLDHMLASHALYGRMRGIEVHNEALGDELLAHEKSIEAAGSYHAGVVASFDL